VQPGVFLSLFELLTTLLTFCAFLEGVVVCFWVKLLHGTTLADIYDVYDCAFPWAALQHVARLQFNKVALATLFMLLSLARGPLLQRALTLESSGATYVMCIPTLVLGLVLSLAGIAVILPLYHGYQSLGRSVSLNPVEIARAFGAAVLEGVDGNATAADVEMEKGWVKVKYGTVERSGCEKVLRVEDSGASSVRGPWEGEILG
jgi:hypothetical protein